MGHEFTVFFIAKFVIRNSWRRDTAVFSVSACVLDYSFNRCDLSYSFLEMLVNEKHFNSS